MRIKPPEGETPAERFIRVAGLRVSNVVEALELLVPLGKDVPSDAFTEQAFKAIDDALVRARNAWATKQGTDRKRSFAFGTVTAANPNQTVIPNTVPQAAPAKPVAAAKR